MAACQAAEAAIPGQLAELQNASAPPPPQWFGQRLPVLWTTFMASRAADPKALTVWLAETAHLLGDLPHDIVAHAIDEAIKNSRHGFMPTVGEIRGVADPMAAERRQQIERLDQMVAALGDPAATAARADRRAEQRLRLAASCATASRRSIVE